jgi:hypothetical protein
MQAAAKRMLLLSLGGGKGGKRITRIPRGLNFFADHAIIKTVRFLNRCLPLML